VKKQPSKVHKLFSLSRWGRRKNAEKFNAAYQGLNFDAMKEETVFFGAPVLSRGSANDLETHGEALKKEFSGQSALALYHAQLIVLIRRDYKATETFDQFVSLWTEQRDWLLENLNIRWLVSACDTFADCDKDDTVRALALATSLLANTVKVYETQHVMVGEPTIDFIPAKVEQVQREAIPLFEGMACFTVGTDDTLRNMVWRMKNIAPKHVTGQILMEVFRRMNHNPTAFGRLQLAHTRKKTQWLE
jgi:hypothetical protein